MIKLYSSCGKAEIVCHPSQVDNMKASGWTEEKPKAKKTKSEKKKEEVKNG